MVDPMKKLLLTLMLLVAAGAYAQYPAKPTTWVDNNAWQDGPNCGGHCSAAGYLPNSGDNFIDGTQVSKIITNLFFYHAETLVRANRVPALHHLGRGKTRQQQTEFFG